MISQKITITNPSGLHLRPAGLLAGIASKCNSEITIICGQNRINAKSVINIMTAGIKKGTEIEVACNGHTEEQDLKTIIAAIAGGLGE
ncbi:phosphocarrier protein [Ruminiclostridium sufflavum DSM 19573]|uniref:Phosphocarrier protein n=1 Tax=Ruminiclostridium sufflavum DSM 19573 TaxID=1121337 RepID=A0A318XMT1_9FIRM|nr:HPr family phosphocarrier protein [Ruminiclostridium sufflavum]PYG87923.1 phosphocarrier protein [Ruminiclostridium sufflavum DSM 19573]